MGRLFSALVLLAVISQAVSSVEPEDRAPAIISRRQWGARPPKSTPQGLRENPPRYVVIHHSTGPTCTTRANCQARIRNIQSYHIDNRGWNDLGYNFLVGEDGNAYEGRGWGIRGAHSPSYNSKSIGICFIGNYMTRRPSSAAIRAAKRIIATGVANGKLKSSYKVLGHRQTYATACPGNSLYNEIQTWPHWSASP